MIQSNLQWLCLVVVLAGPVMLHAQVVDPLTRSRRTPVPARTDSYRADAHTPSAATSRLTAQQLKGVVTHVRIDNAPARQALEWWSSTTNIPMVVNWAELENEGIDLQTTVTLNLRRVPADVLLKLIINQFATEAPVIVETTQWYIQLTSKTHANRNPVMRVYDISDLLIEVPHFDQAPSFDLNSALQNTNSGGSSSGTGGGGRSGGSGGGTIFTDDRDNRDGELRITRQDRAAQLANLIRDTIESPIWQVNGGLYSSVKHFDGHLIVNAPEYVHRQIRIPVVKSQSRRSIRATPSHRQALSTYGSSYSPTSPIRRRANSTPRYRSIPPRSAAGITIRYRSRVAGISYY